MAALIRPDLMGTRPKRSSTCRELHHGRGPSRPNVISQAPNYEHVRKSRETKDECLQVHGANDRRLCSGLFGMPSSLGGGMAHEERLDHRATWRGQRPHRARRHGTTREGNSGRHLSSRTVRVPAGRLAPTWSRKRRQMAPPSWLPAHSASAHAIYSKLPYDTLADFVPVIPLGQQPLVVVTSPSKGYKTLGDLIAAGKAKPGALNYSTAGVGSSLHFAAERIRASADFQAQHIPFKSAAEAAREVIAGRIDFSVQLLAPDYPAASRRESSSRSRSARTRGVRSCRRFRQLSRPVLPPFSSIYPFYTGLFLLPAKTPRKIVDTLYRETAKALRAPAVLARFATLGVEPMPMTHGTVRQVLPRCCRDKCCTGEGGK